MTLQDHLAGIIMLVGRNIKRLRRDLGLTQGDLATKSGIKIGHISKLERNESDPKLSTITKLINALGCSADELLLNPDTTGLNGFMKVSYDRATKLPDKDKEIVIDIIDKYCMANGLKDMINSNYVIVGPKGDVESMIAPEND